MSNIMRKRIVTRQHNRARPYRINPQSWVSVWASPDFVPTWSDDA